MLAPETSPVVIMRFTHCRYTSNELEAVKRD
jgi:hypothetical protein